MGRVSYLSCAVLISAGARSVGAELQNIPNVMLFEGTFAGPSSCELGTQTWESQNKKIQSGYCDTTPFLDATGNKVFGESRCYDIDAVNFTLYTATPNQANATKCDASSYFNTFPLKVGRCTMVAASKGTPPKIGQPGTDPQFPFGAWMSVQKPKSNLTSCIRLEHGYGLYFNSKCSGYPQYSLPGGTANNNKCISTHMGDTSRQQVVAKTTCPNGKHGVSHLALYAMTCGGTPFIEMTLSKNQCAQVATANRSDPLYNPTFPQGAWMSPYADECVAPPPLPKGLSGWDWFGIILLIIVVIVLIGLGGLQMIKTKYVNEDATSIYDQDGQY